MRHLGLLVALIIVVSVSPIDAAPFPARSAPSAQEAGTKASPDRAQLRAQFLQLAPLLSMNDSWRLEELDTQRVIETVNHVRELSEMKFDAAPALQLVGPETVQRYIEAETTVVPQIRLNPHSTDDANTLAAKLLVSGISSFYANQQVRVWQQEHDAFCRKRYQSLLGIAHEVALAEKPLPKTPNIQIGVDGQGATARIVVTNDSDVILKNVTIVLDLTPIDDACAEKPAADVDVARHLYFLPSLPKGRTPLRLSSAWWYIGASGAAGGKLEVIADGYTQSPNRFTFPDNVQPLARKLLDEAKRAAETLPKDPTTRIEKVRDPKLALDRLAIVKRLRAYDSSLKDAAEPVRVELQTDLKAQLDIVQDLWKHAADDTQNHQNQRDEYNKRNQVKEWSRELKRLQDVRDDWKLTKTTLSGWLQATKDLK